MLKELHNTDKPSRGMATIQLKNDADPEEVSAALQSQGITMGQQLEDGRYVVYVNQENFLAYYLLIVCQKTEQQ